MNEISALFPTLSDEELRKEGVITCIGTIISIEDRTSSNYVKLTALVKTPFDGDFYTFPIWTKSMIPDLLSGDVAKIYYRQGGIFRKFKYAVKCETSHECGRCGVLSEEKPVTGRCGQCEYLEEKPLIRQLMRVKSFEVHNYKYSPGIRFTFENGENKEDDNIYYTIIYKNHPDYESLAVIETGNLLLVDAVVKKLIFDEVTLKTLRVYLQFQEAPVVSNYELLMFDFLLAVITKFTFHDTLNTILLSSRNTNKHKAH